MIKQLVTTLPDEIPAGVRYERTDNASPGWTDKVSGWFRYSHAGLVLATGEHNHYDDSDFYAIVWDAEAGAPREVEYATTRGWTYANSATIDATPEVRAAYDAYRARLAAERQAAREALEAATPYAGKTVRVVKGRKIPVGTVAVVTWYGEGRSYGYGSREAGPMRVGLAIDGERVYTDAGNVEVIAQEKPAALPLLRTEFYVLSSVCPVCGEYAGTHEWWDTRGGVPENCNRSSDQ
jgi:hypothetical protein